MGTHHVCLVITRSREMTIALKYYCEEYVITFMLLNLCK